MGLISLIDRHRPRPVDRVGALAGMQAQGVGLDVTGSAHGADLLVEKLQPMVSIRRRPKFVRTTA